MPASMNDHLSEWRFSSRVGLSPKGSCLWLHFPFAACWGLWLERNCRIFEGKATELRKMNDKNFAWLYSWVVHLPLFHGTKY